MAKTQPTPIPSPHMGMNTREGLAALKPAEARYLENWEPAGNGVKPRLGYDEHSTGGVADNPVETVAAFDGLTTSKLIGIGGGSIYDFTSSSASLLSAAGYTDSRFQTECYSNRLIGVNGTDTPWVYDGSTIGATGFTGSGLTISNLITIKKVRNRLWFCEKNSADVWYGGIGSITGALTKFQLSQIAGGGTCMAIGAHSQDAGAGPDDFTAFVMSTGEVILYSGDPATTFTKVGNYKMPPPIGRKCIVNIGGQLAVLTHMGLVPLSAAVAGIAFDVLALGNFGKVSPSILDDVNDYESLEGWEVHFFEGRVVINVPTLSNAASKQWVYNTQTGAWTTWTGLPAAAFAVWGDEELYFGSWAAGTVFKRTGTNDNGSAISLSARQAFVSRPDGCRMTAKAIRFDMAVDGAVTGRFGIDVDYIARPITIPNVAIATSFATTPWASPWGSAWSSSNQYNGQWFSTYGQGRSLGLALEASGTVSALEWYGSHILTEPAGGL